MKTDVFNGCVNLTGLELNSGLEKIGNYVIYGCSSLESLTIPATVNDIAFGAFNSNSLKSFEVENGNQWYSSVSGLLTDAARKNVIRGVVKSDNIDLPETIETIGEMAFYYSEIGVLNCNEGLNSIEREAFWGSSLSKINFPNTLTSIKEAAFRSCSNLKVVEFPQSLTELGKKVFDHASLEEIKFTGGVKVIPDELCTSCRFLKRIDLTGVEKIGLKAFSHNAVDSLYIPETVIEIDSRAFCPILPQEIKYIKCFAAEPPILGDAVFSEYAMPETEVFVPESSLDLYRNAEVWKDFNLKGFPYVSSVLSTPSATPTHWTVYTLDGRQLLNTANQATLRTLTPGLYIINGKKTLIR